MCRILDSRNEISPAICLVAAFNCAVGSRFSNSSIRALYSIYTMSILSTIPFARMTTFRTFSSKGPSGSTCMFDSSEHNSATVFLMLASSFYHCTIVASTF